MKIIWWSVLLMLGSQIYITHKLSSVGVPPGFLLVFSFFYGMFWPFRLMEEVKDDNDNQTPNLD